MSYLQTPSIWEIIKGAWPWFWGISKMIWPVWLLLAIMLIILIIKWKIEKFVEYKDKKKCPDCAEWIPKEAKKCSHCGNKF